MIKEIITRPGDSLVGPLTGHQQIQSGYDGWDALVGRIRCARRVPEQGCLLRRRYRSQPLSAIP